ncbi:MAG: TSUP family transporter [Chitinophagaceae bacterium]|nr:TSUP family transporter [Chitinophagaceae bacterium]MBK8953910.1 TSUP family transporter [Chitinophagaceae bacterium]
MNFLDLLHNYSALTLLVLFVLAFTAGFIDSVVGGGGLIQLPAMLISFPNTPLPTLFGTNKISALSGTAVAAFQYARRVKFEFLLLAVVSLCALASSYAGARAVSAINVKALKPVILVILVLIAVYTYFKKDLGSVQTKQLSLNRKIIFGSLIGLAVGFYDGFFGPGTGSFFVLGFVVLLGYEFVTASAYAKILNCMTNIAALFVFIRQGNYLLLIAILMAVGNVAGSILGSRTAIRRGNAFIRNVFLVIVSLMILRYSYDIFFG